MTSSESRPPAAPRLSVSDVQRLAAAQLSLPSRIGHVLLLLVALTMAAAIGSLWATEPWLPARTHVAFALIVTIALAWAAFATWVLARRRMLFGTDRVLAAQMGLAFATISTVGMLAIGYWGGVGRPAYLAALLESPLCIVAAVLLGRGKRHVEALSGRKRELERQLGMAE